MLETNWNLSPPPGFQGLEPHKPVSVYHRHLPHWRQDGATYFVTFRQNDSLPQARIRELHAIREEWERRNPPPRNDRQWKSLVRETTRLVEGWLDEGMGSCRLKDRRAQEKAIESLHYFQDERYELGCYVVMPNHVHALVRPLQPRAFPLESILHSWKRHTAAANNKLFGLDGAFWQDESYDRIVRDEDHLWRCIQYIGRNPAKAGLSNAEYRLLVRPEWVKLGWTFEESVGS